MQPYRGLKIPKVQQWHKNLQIFMGTTLWLWLFWRIKHDGPALFVRRLAPERPDGRSPRARGSAPLTSDHGYACSQGFCHPWDHGDHGHDDHGEEGHGH